ncbi:MAG: hypothetical protein BDTLLHRC_000796 [Candidatus Fervidibacter sp.]
MAVRQAQCPHSNRTKPKIKSYQSPIAIHYSLLAIRYSPSFRLLVNQVALHP